MLLYAVLDIDSEYVELWNEATAWLDGTGWVGHGFLTMFNKHDIPEHVRDAVSDGKVHEFRVAIRYGEEVTACR